MRSSSCPPSAGTCRWHGPGSGRWTEARCSMGMFPNEPFDVSNNPCGEEENDDLVFRA